MNLNTATFDALYTGFNTQLQAGFGMAPKTYQQFSMTLSSATKMETYAWLILMSRMRQWLGPRQIKNAEKKAMQVTNDDYEHTVGVDRNDIEDDTLGVYAPLFQQMGQDAAGLWHRLAVAAMVANGTWIDAAAFFSASRKYGANTIKNYVTGALTATTFETARQEMESYLGFDNNPLGVVPNLLVVGPKLRQTAWHIVKDEWVAVGTTNTTTATKNPNYGAAELLVLPELVGTYDDYWFLADTRGAVKPVAVQQRKTGALVRWDTDKDTCVKEHNRNDYGLHYRGAASLTLPHLIYGGFVA